MLAHFDAMMECHLSTHLAAMDLCVTSEFQIQRTVPISKLVCCYFTAFLCIFEPAAESQEKCILHSTSIRHALPKTITHTFRCCKRHTRKKALLRDFAHLCDACCARAQRHIHEAMDNFSHNTLTNRKTRHY